MITFSGRVCDLDKGVPTLYDIAVHLTRQFRYGGARVWPTSLHSLMVADLMPLEYRVYGLLHDVDEVLSGEIPRPFKTSEQRKLQTYLRGRILLAYKIPLATERIEHMIKAADEDAGNAEIWRLFPDHRDEVKTEPRNYTLQLFDYYEKYIDSYDITAWNGRIVQVYYKDLCKNVYKAARVGSNTDVLSVTNVTPIDTTSTNVINVGMLSVKVDTQS